MANLGLYIASPYDPLIIITFTIHRFSPVLSLSTSATNNHPLPQLHNPTLFVCRVRVTTCQTAIHSTVSSTHAHTTCSSRMRTDAELNHRVVEVSIHTPIHPIESTW